MRHAGYCTDLNGLPVASRKAAREAEGVKRRAAPTQPSVVVCAKDLSFGDAAAALLPLWERQDDWKNKKRYLRELLAFFGAQTPVRFISEAKIQDYVAFALNQKVQIWTGGSEAENKHTRLHPARRVGSRVRAPATVNLHLHVLRQIIRRAAKSRDESGNPVLSEVPVVPILKTPKRKARPVPDAVLTRVMSLLPAHSVKAIFLTLFFGFRQSEVFTLQKHQIDFAAGGIRLDAENVKDDEDAFLPGAPDGMAFLALLAGEAELRGTNYLITLSRKGRWIPLRSPRQAWSSAMKVVQEEFGRKWRWHDIRAAFITHVALTSGPELARTLARHSEYSTTLRYVAVADEMRREAARRAAIRPALTGAISVKVPNKSPKQRFPCKTKSPKPLIYQGDPVAQQDRASDS